MAQTEFNPLHDRNPPSLLTIALVGDGGDIPGGDGL
jgi:hypothetical protein